LAAKIEKAFPDTRVRLQPGGRGDFIVTADGRELWNKLQMRNRFPLDDEIVEALRKE
jgi:hypothetical protein